MKSTIEICSEKFFSYNSLLPTSNIIQSRIERILLPVELYMVYTHANENDRKMTIVHLL